ncbi:BZ3500_MvSof-1268-A1-R1_Chr12-2g03842 [Microbotryum saponariae]|uniref:ATP-dependent DNA helicase n=1 Tax=Microbotryum saponariae TaxID=289078 RepID=A0A2X0KRV5_9BASI|nr:BZ3500_MvSof-1268-A1-R1_Chr12-2g03842 [Microbotryum saponariae]
MPAACNIATNSSNNSLQHVLFECQHSSCFFTTLNVSDTAEGLTSLWSGELRLTIPWQILNGSVRKSEAMPSRYSMARFGGVTVVLAGDPKQCLPVIPKSSPTQIVDTCIMNADFWGDLSTNMRLLAAADRMTGTERAKAIRR